MRHFIFYFWLSLFIWAGQALAAPDAYAADQLQESADIEVFVHEGCPHCARAKEFLAGLQREQPKLRVVIRDVGQDAAALERLQQIAAKHAVATARVPAFLVGGQLIVGYSDDASSGRLIRDALTPAPATAIPGSFVVDFLGYGVSPEELGLPLFTVALGLLDGFNPCSMWVLILMISLLAPLHDRTRMLTIAGTFVAVEGIAYFAFMAAWLNLFLLIGLSRASEIVIAVIALLAGAINLKDFRYLGKGISLSIPAAAKPGIYARMRSILQAESHGAALLGAAVLAILVQIVEFMCTSGFPALFTRILTLKQLDYAGYYGYLLLYDLSYMLDDLIVLAIGVITLSQRRLQEKEGRWLKLASGLVMVTLGIYLLL